jgi:hypothetical protein
MDTFCQFRNFSARSVTDLCVQPDEEKHVEKTKKQQEKEAAKTERHVEKEKHDERNRLLKLENSKSVEVTSTPTQNPTVLPESGASTSVLPKTHTGGEDLVPSEPSIITSVPIAEHATTDPLVEHNADGASSTPAENQAIVSRKLTKADQVPTTPTKKRFSTFLTKLKRKPKDKKTDEYEKGSFAGGAAFTHASHPDANPHGTAAEASPSISSLESDDELVEPRGRTKRRGSSGSTEEFEEARDYIDSEGLAPPPTSLSKKTESPARETRFKEAL